MRALLVIALLLLPCAAHAEATAQEVIDLYNKADQRNRNKVLEMLRREFDGMMWMQLLNTKMYKSPKFYCTKDSDEELALLNGENLLDVMKKATGADPKSSHDPFPVVMLMGLRLVYPCKKEEKQ
jgi:hypothetical protein